MSDDDKVVEIAPGVHEQGVNSVLDEAFAAANNPIPPTSDYVAEPAVIGGDDVTSAARAALVQSQQDSENLVAAMHQKSALEEQYRARFQVATFELNQRRWEYAKTGLMCLGISAFVGGVLGALATRGRQ